MQNLENYHLLYTTSIEILHLFRRNVRKTEVFFYQFHFTLCGFILCGIRTKIIQVICSK